MAFQGSLSELPLPDIVQLVSVSGKTGRFVLTSEGQQGVIYLREGQIIHAETPELRGEEAVYALAIWDKGEFQFEAGSPHGEQTIEKSNTNLLMEAARRLDEWRVLSKKIPSIDMVPALKADPNRKDQVTLGPQEWLLVTAIDGKRTISQIAESVSLTAFDVAKVLYGMVGSDLVTLKKKLQ